MDIETSPLVIGAPLQGGFYAGQIRIADALHILIVSPKTGELASAPWHAKAADVADATSFFDGAANTAAMLGAECPHAIAVRNLEIAGFTDWYLPSRDELELLYRHFKPTTETNYVHRHGDNPSSVPAGYPYTEALPAQTPALAFQAGGAEAFEDAWHWSSTQHSRNNAWGQYFDDGDQYDGVKSYEGRARAVRRFIP